MACTVGGKDRIICENGIDGDVRLRSPACIQASLAGNVSRTGLMVQISNETAHNIVGGSRTVLKTPEPLSCSTD
jgi:hypothetical protein